MTRETEGEAERADVGTSGKPRRLAGRAEAGLTLEAAVTMTRELEPAGRG